jgi:hypothetical protein
MQHILGRFFHSHVLLEVQQLFLDALEGIGEVAVVEGGDPLSDPLQQ